MRKERSDSQTHRYANTERERERERERARAHPQNPDHASPQPSFDQASQAPIMPAYCPDHAPAKHPRPTNTGPPRSQPTPPSSPFHLFDRQPCTDKLRSWQPIAGHAPLGSPMHWPPPLIADLAATDHQPTPFHPQTHPIWLLPPPSTSILSFPQSLALSSPSHWVCE